MKRLVSVLLIPSLVLTAAGCASDADNFTTTRLSFGDCPKELTGVSKERTCATSLVPLRHDEPAGTQIELLVARYPAETTSKGQLWLLDGGPGGTGATYMSESFLPIYRQLGYDLFIPQHRGTGHSTPLACVNPDSPASCGAELVEKWGNDLSGFSSVEAGYDVGSLIERTRTPDESVFVFGLSYGTYWGQRYLQAYPNQADGVMLDGVLPLDVEPWKSDAPSNDAGLRLLKACSEDPACNRALGGDPLATANRVLDKAREPSTRCEGEGGFGRADLSQIFANVMSLEIATLIPALLLRLERCNETDVNQLTHFRSALAQIIAEASATDLESANPALGYQVLRTDILTEFDRQLLPELESKRDKLVVWAGGLSLEQAAQIASEWPVSYPPIRKTLAAAQVPLLISNGGFDVQTPLPWANELAEANDSQALVFPYAGHAVDYSLGLQTLALASCSIQIKSQFLENPKGKLDTSCLKDLPAPDFGAQTEFTKSISEMLFGTPEYLPGFAASTSAPQASSEASNTAGYFDARALLAERLRKQPGSIKNLRRTLAVREIGSGFTLSSP